MSYEDRHNAVAIELDKLKRKYGVDKHNFHVIARCSPGNKKNMDLIRRYDLTSVCTLSSADMSVVRKAEEIVEKHGRVFIIFHEDSYTYEFYPFPSSLSDNQSLKSIEDKPSTTGGCFIATACYGSYSDPEVLILRQFRDELLLNFIIGKVFVKFYYAVSPPLADFIAARDGVKSVVRSILLGPLVRLIKRNQKIIS